MTTTDKKRQTRTHILKPRTTRTNKRVKQNIKRDRQDKKDERKQHIQTKGQQVNKIRSV